jgi:hypothetical protein
MREQLETLEKEKMTFIEGNHACLWTMILMTLFPNIGYECDG